MRVHGSVGRERQWLTPRRSTGECSDGWIEEEGRGELAHRNPFRVVRTAAVQDPYVEVVVLASPGNWERAASALI